MVNDEAGDGIWWSVWDDDSEVNLQVGSGTQVVFRVYVVPSKSVVFCTLYMQPSGTKSPTVGS